MMPVVRKMPDPMTLPMTSRVAPHRPMARTSWASAATGADSVVVSVDVDMVRVRGRRRRSILRAVKRAESRSMSRRRTALAALVLAALAGSCESSAPSMTDQPAADLLVLNGRVFTADDQGTVAQAVAVSGNTVLRVGTDADLAALRGPSTRVIDAHGAIVAPGFNDSHVHFVDGGFSLGKVDLAGATTLPQIQDRIRTFAATNAAAAWVEGFGWLYSPFAGGSPTKAQLDAIVADRPAMMACYDGHSIWVNSRALALAGITKDTPNPVNGVVVKDATTGEPTGH